MPNPISLVDRKILRIKAIINGAAITVNDVLLKYEELDRMIDQIGADVTTMRDEISEALVQISDIQNTPDLADDKRASISAIADECEKFRFAPEALAQDIAAELQVRASGIGNDH